MGKVKQTRGNEFELITNVAKINAETLATLELDKDFYDLDSLNDEIKAIEVPDGKLLEIGMHVTLRFVTIDQKIQKEDKNIKFIKERIKNTKNYGV